MIATIYADVTRQYNEQDIQLKCMWSGISEAFLFGVSSYGKFLNPFDAFIFTLEWWFLPLKIVIIWKLLSFDVTNEIHWAKSKVAVIKKFIFNGQK